MRVRIVTTVVGLLLVSSIASVFLVRQLLFRSLDDEVAVDLRQEVEEFRLLLGGNDPLTGRPFGGDVRAIFDVYFAREVPDEGESLLAFVDGELYRSARAQDAAEADELDEAIAHWLSLDAREEASIGTPLGEARYVALPVRRNGSEAMFVAANFPAFERSEIDEAVRTQAFTQLVTLVLASLLGMALAGRVLRPLRSLADTARTITDTDLTGRIRVRGQDEASQIAEAFNDMVERLEHVIASQRDFLDDAGHELRTPLTVIRGHLELLELDGTSEERRATVDLVMDEIDRMHRMVNDLLLLALAEQPDFVTVEPFDLDELMGSVFQKVTALGRRDWRFDGAPHVVLHGDRQRLTQALMQLADNATRHTQAGDVISVGALRDGAQARLWVHDRGSGVLPADRDRIFRRFRRGSAPSRPGSAGLGLGLAIVEAIAEAHRGTVRLAPHDGPGARFEIVLPVTSGRPRQLEGPAEGGPGTSWSRGRPR